MNTNTLIILVVIAMIAFGGFFLMTKEVEEEAPEVLPESPRDGHPELTGYNDEPKSWADYAQGIKDYIIDPNGNTDKQFIYDTHGGTVRKYLKGNDIEQSGWAVKVLASKINKYIAEGGGDGKKWYEVKIGEFLN